MRTVALVLAFLLGSVVGASAACVSPSIMHDFPGTAFSMSLGTNADGNCQPNVGGGFGNNLSSLPPVASGLLGEQSFAYVLSGGNWVPGNPVDFGVAGIPGNDVMTIQGTTGMLPVLVDPNTPGNWGIGTAGSGGLPAFAVYMGISSGGNLTGWNGALTSQYASGALPITASATGTATAITATLAANATKTTYICGFSIRANATAVATGNSTVTGTISGAMNFTQWTAPAATGLGITEMVFSPCIPGSAINTGIAILSAIPGAGGTVSVSAWGYQL
jgi:hypothetical protein